LFINVHSLYSKTFTSRTCCFVLSPTTITFQTFFSYPIVTNYRPSSSTFKAPSWLFRHICPSSSALVACYSFINLYFQVTPIYCIDKIYFKIKFYICSSCIISRCIISLVCKIKKVIEFIKELLPMLKIFLLILHPRAPSSFFSLFPKLLSALFILISHILKLGSIIFNILIISFTSFSSSSLELAHILIFVITICSLPSFFHSSIELLCTCVSQSFLFIIFISFILITQCFVCFLYIFELASRTFIRVKIRMVFFC